jgi:hypothetical protein
MMFLVAPLSWEHHIVYVLPSALMTIRMLFQDGARKRVLVPVVAALFALAWDFPRDEMFYLSGVLAITNTVKFFAVFGLWVFCAWRLREALREGAEPRPEKSPAAAAIAA